MLGCPIHGAVSSRHGWECKPSPSLCCCSFSPEQHLSHQISNPNQNNPLQIVSRNSPAKCHVKPQINLTLSKSMRSMWHFSYAPLAKIEVEEKLGANISPSHPSPLSADRTKRSLPIQPPGSCITTAKSRLCT